MSKAIARISDERSWSRVIGTNKLLYTFRRTDADHMLNELLRC